MIALTDARLLAPHRGRLIAAVGVFDGVHAGHRTILREMVAHASAENLLPVAVTFEPHPDQVLGRMPAARRLSTPRAKAELIGGLGVQAVWALPFDLQFAALAAEEFVAQYLVAQLAPRYVYVGFNFTFGHRGSGTAEQLADLGRAAGFGVRVFGPLTGNGGVVSSTKAREALVAGDVRLAARLLCRPYRVQGEVVPGDHRGTGLGFPTANLQVPDSVMLPGHGVYAAWAVLAGRAWPAVVNIGSRPTFAADGPVVVEVHLIGYRGGELYGFPLELIWIERLRDEMRFAAAAELCIQIGQDVAGAIRLLRRDHDDLPDSAPQPVPNVLE